MGREKETKDMEKFELPDLPIAIVHCPGQEPGITMPLSVCLRLVALARATVERAAADDQKFPPPRLLGLKTLTPEEADSVIRQINENITEALESAGLEQDDEDLADRAAIEAARASGEERVPHALVKRLLAGDHPVKVYREHRGLTQVELAARTGLSAMYLSQIETGRRSGTTKTLRKIARALGVDLEWNDSEVVTYAVFGLSGDVRPGEHALTGEYVGAEASATAGVGLGVRTLIGAGNNHITLQPLGIKTGTGFGAAAGLSFLHLFPAGPSLSSAEDRRRTF